MKGAEIMAVFRIEKNKGYTVMSNHHLRNKGLPRQALACEGTSKISIAGNAGNRDFLRKGYPFPMLAIPLIP